MRHHKATTVNGRVVGQGPSRREFLATLAHELHQPLAAILGNAQAARRFLADGAIEPDELRAILDDTGRPMVLANWNTDMGDGWEWSNAEEYPGYLKWTTVAYQMMINEVVYALTH